MSIIDDVRISVVLTARTSPRPCNHDNDLNFENDLIKYGQDY